MSEPRHALPTVAPDGKPAHHQPGWRTEFPIEVAADRDLSLRQFLGFLVLTSLAFVFGQLWIGVQAWLRRRRGQPSGVEVARLAEVPVGGWLRFSYPDPEDVCLLLRPDEPTLLAYNQKCTHLSCAVIPEIAGGRLECPCHRGVFELATGRPLAGPPRRPLTRIVLEVRDGVVFAVGEELRTV
jgi:Rieske Fe-S protein